MFGDWPKADAGQERLQRYDGLNDLIREIEHALKCNLKYLSVVATLTLPDVCCGLISKDGETTPARYAAWWEKWVAHKYPPPPFPTPNGPRLTGVDVWALRCGIVHQGRGEHKKSAFVRVLFTYGDKGVRAHNCLIGPTPEEPALQLDPDQFCADVIESAREWWEANKNEKSVQENWPKLLKVYPIGLAPYIAGSPLFA